MPPRLRLPFALPRRGTNSHLLTLAVPFASILLLGTYGLSYLTQTRYEYHDRKQHALDKKEQLKIEKSAKPFNLQEAYFNLTKNKNLEDWDMVRVPRPEGEE
ncbi:cytochrome c oxidase assembly protein COX16-domain-containing protein [Phlyctochytrium arcticum]|nr:cytochrome c oxidase assembly protein COX16-domain-containing protein [Phlyctochytrium arcticum]